jgi:hypothetical protein
MQRSPGASGLRITFTSVAFVDSYLFAPSVFLFFAALRETVVTQRRKEQKNRRRKGLSFLYADL